MAGPRKTLRDGVRRGMQLERLPPACPLKPIRHSVRHDEGYTVENVAFESLPGFWVTGNLYLPEKLDGKDRRRPLPARPLADNRMTRAHANALRRAGPHGRASCSPTTWSATASRRPCRTTTAETMRLQTYNSMRAVDFLLSLGIVDDTRLARHRRKRRRHAVVPPGVPRRPHRRLGPGRAGLGPLLRRLHLRERHADPQDRPSTKPTTSRSPRRSHPSRSWSSPTATTGRRTCPEVEFPYIHRVYELCGAEANVENAHFADEKHDYGPSKRAAMYRFMAKHLKLDLSQVQNASGEIDESFAAVHDAADLHVFTADHPRPDHAVNDAEAVIKNSTNANFDFHDHP